MSLTGPSRLVRIVSVILQKTATTGGVLHVARIAFTRRGSPFSFLWRLLCLDVCISCFSEQLVNVLRQGYGIINLFLLANLITTTSTLPVLLGLLEGERVQRIITPLSALFGCWFSFASLILWAYFNAPGWELSFNAVSACFPPLQSTHHRYMSCEANFLFQDGMACTVCSKLLI